MLENLSPEADLLEPAAAPELAGRSGLHEHVVVVEVARPPFARRCARRRLLVDVRHVLLPERAVVKPVVAHPAIDHRIHRHRHLQRRMRVDQRHQRQEPVVRDAEDADLAVALGHVLHQPVDRVVGVGGVIDRRRILRPAQRPVHHVVAFGAVLAADVLDDADVAAFDDHFEWRCRSRPGSDRGARCERGRSVRWRCTACASAGSARRARPWAPGSTVCSFTPSRIGIMTSRLT